MKAIFNICENPTITTTVTHFSYLYYWLFWGWEVMILPINIITSHKDKTNWKYAILYMLVAITMWCCWHW
jgi:hypothetical protein